MRNFSNFLDSSIYILEAFVQSRYLIVSLRATAVTELVEEGLRGLVLVTRWYLVLPQLGQQTAERMLKWRKLACPSSGMSQEALHWWSLSFGTVSGR